MKSIEDKPIIIITTPEIQHIQKETFNDGLVGIDIYDYDNSHVIYKNIDLGSFKELIKRNQEMNDLRGEKMKETITLEEIKELYDELNNRECGDSYFTKYDGTIISLDTGYAFEGIDLFIEELEHKLEAKKESE